MGQPLHCSAADAGVWGERLWWRLHPLHRTQQYCLASMAARLFSAGISHHSLLPHIPSICLSTVSSSPSPGIAPQSLNYSSQPLRLPGHLHPCPGMYGCSKDIWFSSHLGYHRSAVSLSALTVSPLIQTIPPMWGSDPCFGSPTRWGQVQSYWHSCFSP